MGSGGVPNRGVKNRMQESWSVHINKTQESIAIKMARKYKADGMIIMAGQ